MPGLSWPIVRPKEVHLTGYDLDGNELSVEADEYLARVFQHEVDHLDGVLLVERLDEDQRKEAKRILRAPALGLPDLRRVGVARPRGPSHAHRPVAAHAPVARLVFLGTPPPPRWCSKRSSTPATTWPSW